MNKQVDIRRMTNTELNSEIERIIKSAGSTTYSVTFLKSNGEKRTLNGHNKVSKHLKGGNSTISHKNNLHSVFDMALRQYRTFYYDNVLSCNIKGTKYVFRREM